MIFKFKEFDINQDKTAMKIGTDSVLLGSWTSINKPYSILDIGTGTGILALQLAQRTDAEIIDAIEIEDNAFEQAVENFEHSPWNNRLFCYHASLSEFVNEIEEKYDLIISNPPFYTDDYKSVNIQRNLARLSYSLPFEELIESVAKLLDKNGLFSVIIPYKEKELFTKIANSHNLYLNKVCNVKGNLNSKFKRSLLEFSFTNKLSVSEELIIEIKRHKYTKQYINLVKDFYLKM